MHDVGMQVCSGYLARLRRRGCIARLRRRGCLACTCRMYGRLLSRPLRPRLPCGRRARKFVTSADAAGSVPWLPWALFVSPCNSAWIRGLASQAGGFRYLNQTWKRKGDFFVMRFGGYVFGDVFGMWFGGYVSGYVFRWYSRLCGLASWACFVP